MNTKEELQNCLHEIKFQKILKVELNNLFEDLFNLQDKKLCHTDRYIKINEQIEIIEKLIEESEQIVNKLKLKMNKIDQPYKNILFLRYINGKSYDDIAFITHYSTARIFQLHREAVDIYDKKFSNSSNSNYNDDKSL